MPKFKAGDTAYLIESNRIIREVTVVRCSGGMYLVKFSEGSGIQVKEHRLFSSVEEAEDHIPSLVEQKKKEKQEFFMNH